MCHNFSVCCFWGGGVNFGEGANFVYFLVNFWVD